MVMLSSLPEVQRKQFLEGDWEAFEGAAFPEISKYVQVIEPLEIFKIEDKDIIIPKIIANVEPKCVIYLLILCSNIKYYHSLGFFFAQSGITTHKKIPPINVSPIKI